MLSAEAYFKLMFNDEKTTDSAKAAFCVDLVLRLNQERRPPFTTWAAGLDPLVRTLQAELGEVDTSLQKQKTMTRTADDFMVDFGRQLTKASPVIAAALGGVEASGYLEFFPEGLDEYTQAPKKNVLRLTQRLGALAAEYSAHLPEALVRSLTGLEGEWRQCSGGQTTSRKTTKQNRNERSEARMAVDLMAHKVGHWIAAEFPGNVER
ncbi:MAG: hypothetical protein EOP49_12105, partial [Sphingobacteriales bacterium]